MSYCKNCSHTLEITKNVNTNTEDNIKVLNKPEDIVNIELLELEPKKKKYVGDIQYSINFSELIIKNYFKTFDTKKLEKFKITPEDFKLKVIFRYKQIVKQQRIASSFILECSNCGSTFFLEPGTTIYSINYERSIHQIDEETRIKCTDLTLPRTKDFVCPNNKCINNTDTSDEVLLEKEAVFYRNPKEYNLKYICCQCYFQWGT